MSANIKISRYQTYQREAILTLSIAAWGPVFPAMQREVPNYVFDAFYPNGWQTRQTADIGTYLDNEPDLVWIASIRDEIVGWIGGRVHLEDNMGEVYILAVSPYHQRKGIARTLMQHFFDHLRSRGVAMVMVETGADSGHAASRATYEMAGFERWPVARYFKKI